MKEVGGGHGSAKKKPFDRLVVDVSTLSGDEAKPQAPHPTVASPKFFYRAMSIYDRLHQSWILSSFLLLLAVSRSSIE